MNIPTPTYNDLARQANDRMLGPFLGKKLVRMRYDTLKFDVLAEAHLQDVDTGYDSLTRALEVARTRAGTHDSPTHAVIVIVYEDKYYLLQANEIGVAVTTLRGNKSEHNMDYRVYDKSVCALVNGQGHLCVNHGKKRWYHS